MNVSIYLEDDLYEAVVCHAAKHNVSKNSVIRKAIREMVMEDTPHSMCEGQADFAHEQDFSKFSDCKTLKEAFTKAGKMV